VTTEIENLQRQIDALKRQHGQPVGDRGQFIEAQARAHSAYQAIGDSAPPPLSGECIGPYRARLIAGLQHFCPKWKAISLSGISDPVLLGNIEADVYNDCQVHSADQSRFRPGELRAVIRNDAAGRPITRYVGDPNACWDQFCPPTRFAKAGLLSFKTSGVR
jgi:hypothetical protein